MLFNEPKLLKSRWRCGARRGVQVSVLFNEPKLLKFVVAGCDWSGSMRFSALQRAEIAEIQIVYAAISDLLCFSALQRAEIAEMCAVGDFVQRL